MAVVFLVEDGTGLEDATSYVSVVFADDYMSIKPTTLKAAWVALDSTGKQNYLMWATRLLDQRARWRGTKAVPESALEWPRNSVYDRDGLLVASDEVPEQIEAATVEIANHLLKLGVDPSAPAQTTISGVKRQKLGPLEIEYKDNSAIITNYFPVGLNQLLFPLGSMPGGGGSSAARIIRA